jgi:hypothetical protein
MTEVAVRNVGGTGYADLALDVYSFTKPPYPFVIPNRFSGEE